MRFNFILISLLGISSGLVIAQEQVELLTIKEIAPESPAAPAKIEVKVASSLKEKYCHVTLNADVTLNSSAYTIDGDNYRWKKVQFAKDSEILITGTKNFGEWEVSTLVDNFSGPLTFKIPVDSVEVLCESGAYVLGDKPIVVRDVQLFADQALTQELCVLPAGEYTGSITVGRQGPYKRFVGETVNQLCQAEEVYGQLKSEVIRPRSRFE